MSKYELKRDDYENFGNVFVEKANGIEELYKERLQEDKVQLPLASNFAWGETLAGTISGSPEERLPEWVKELLRKAWNESLTEYFEYRDKSK